MISDFFFNSLNILVPTECHICEKPTWGDPLCFDCEPAIPAFSESMRCSICWDLSMNEECLLCKYHPCLFDSLRYLWNYADNQRLYIHGMKYRPSLELAQRAGQALAEALLKFYPDTRWDLVIPVPCAPMNLKKRGFNQSEILAKELYQKHRHILGKLASDRILMTKKRAPQSSKTPEERLKGLKNIFSVRQGLASKSVLLIDDVLTTGVTVSEMTLALKRAGASRVNVLVLARIPEWNKHRAKLFERFKGR